MNDNESRKIAYREQLCDFLCKRNITINEYAEALGEEYISQLLCPDDSNLDDYIKAFEMFKEIDDYQQTSYVDPTTNLAYSMFDYSIQGLKDKTKYKELEDALFIIMKNPMLKGQLDIDMMTISSHTDSLKDVFSNFSEIVGSPANYGRIMAKVFKNIDLLGAKVTRRLNTECPEIMVKDFEIRKASCIKKYILSHKDAYAYLLSMKSTTLEKK